MASLAYAQSDDKPITGEHPDAAFLRQAARICLLEIALSDLAPERIESSDVKALARRIGVEHGRFQSSLELLAAHVKIKLNESLNDLERQQIATLSAQSGAEFDKRYIGHIVTTYNNTIAAFKHQSEHATDPDTRALASEVLPKLQDDLKEARRIVADTKAQQTTKPASQPATTQPATSRPSPGSTDTRPDGKP
jgi:putative membrane protein